MVFPSIFRRISTRSHLPVFCPRNYATGPPSAQHSIYISKSTNPYFNLTLEDWLFRHKAPEEPLLLIYRDEPCVVIGRHQNPWKEVNFKALRVRPGVPFVRRRSGGGTVYHDLGNTNFSIHLPRHSFHRHVTAQIVVRAVRSLGIDAHANDRNDICVGDEKVSGSAYKIVNNRAYHHGTMLISSNLETLGDLLATDKDTMITKGVASVRSPVCNLQQFNSKITHDAFTNAIVQEFQNEYGVDTSAHVISESEELKNLEYIRKGLDELPSWDWAFGQTPEFTYTINHSFPWGKVSAEIQSKHGIIDSCVLNTHLETGALEMLTQLSQSFVGQRYGFTEHNPSNPDRIGPRQDLAVWLREAMMA